MHSLRQLTLCLHCFGFTLVLDWNNENKNVQIMLIFPFAWARPPLQPHHIMTSFCASLVPWHKFPPDQWSLSAEIELSISRVELTCSVAKTWIVFSNTCDILTVGLRKLPTFAQQRLNDCLTKQILLCETSQNDFDLVHSCLLNRNNWVKTNY